MRTTLAILDAVLAAVLVAGLVTAATTVIALVTGSDLVAVKHALFVVGLLLFGVAGLQWRSSIDLDADPEARHGSSIPPDGPSRLRSVLEAILPEALILPRSARVSEAAKLTLAGVVVLLFSYLMEEVFGIGV